MWERSQRNKIRIKCLRRKKGYPSNLLAVSLFIWLRKKNVAHTHTHGSTKYGLWSICFFIFSCLWPYECFSMEKHTSFNIFNTLNPFHYKEHIINMVYGISPYLHLALYLTLLLFYFGCIVRNPTSFNLIRISIYASVCVYEFIMHA